MANYWNLLDEDHLMDNEYGNMKYDWSEEDSNSYGRIMSCNWYDTMTDDGSDGGLFHVIVFCLSYYLNESTSEWWWANNFNWFRLRKAKKIHQAAKIIVVLVIIKYQIPAIISYLFYIVAFDLILG